LHARQRRHRQNIERDDLAATGHQFGGQLRPAARSCTEVNDAHARPDQLVARIEFLELERRPGAVALLLGALDVGITEVLPQPAGTTLAARHPRLQSRGTQPGAAAPAVSAAPPSRPPPPQTLQAAQTPASGKAAAQRAPAPRSRTAGWPAPDPA